MSGEPEPTTTTAPARALSIRERSASFAPGGPISAAEWSALAEIGQVIGNTEFVPRDLRGKAPAIMACLLYGREQGIGPMTSLQEISVIDGKPSMSAALMLAKIRAAGHSVTGTVDAKHAKVTGKRIDNADEMEYEFTVEMAARAGLAGKSSWQKYPEAMLWARVVSQLARFHFSDVFVGSVYTPEEIGAEVNEEGQPVIEHKEVKREEAPVAAADDRSQPGAPEDPDAVRSGPESDGQAGQPDARAGTATGQVEPAAEPVEPQAAVEKTPEEMPRASELQDEPQEHLTVIEAEEARSEAQAALKMPVEELTMPVIQKLKRAEAIAYLEALGIEYDPESVVGEFRGQIAAYVETLAAATKPVGELFEGDAGEAERAARIAQVAGALEYAEKEGLKTATTGRPISFRTVKDKAPEFFGRQIETLADLTDEELENLWRAMPDAIKPKATT